MYVTISARRYSAAAILINTRTQVARPACDWHALIRDGEAEPGDLRPARWDTDRWVPTTAPAFRRVSVYLPDSLIDQARAIGDGCVSAGLRVAVALHKHD